MYANVFFDTLRWFVVVVVVGVIVGGAATATATQLYVRAELFIKD